MGYREDIVSYCRENLGCKYDYTPSGGVEGQSYNCSFLSTCAYASAGLEIPHWQGHQNGDGSQSDWVRWHDHWTDDPDELLPGDLVFFGEDPYNTGHVGVSLGGWRMIDSVPNGGVQIRTLYDSFVGGGWPMEVTPEEIERDRQRIIAGKLRQPMNVIVTMPAEGVAFWLCNDTIHDLTDPKDIDLLDRLWMAGHGGEQMPREQMNGDDYKALLQSIRGGIPKSLEAYNNAEDAQAR